MSTNSKKISPDEAISQLKNLGPFVRSHAASLQRIHERRVELIGAAGVVDSIAAGETDSLSKHGAEMDALDREDRTLRAAIGPAHDAIRRLFPAAYQKIEQMQAELESLHQTNQERIFRYVSKKIEGALPGWLTPVEIRWVAMRAAPYREEATFENTHQAGSNIPLQLWRDEESKEMVNIPTDQFMENPGAITDIIARLEISLVETRKRKAHLEKSLS